MNTKHCERFMLVYSYKFNDSILFVFEYQQQQLRVHVVECAMMKRFMTYRKLKFRTWHIFDTVRKGFVETEIQETLDVIRAFLAVVDVL